MIEILTPTRKIISSILDAGKVCHGYWLLTLEWPDDWRRKQAPETAWPVCHQLHVYCVIVISYVRCATSVASVTSVTSVALRMVLRTLLQLRFVLRCELANLRLASLALSGTGNPALVRSVVCCPAHRLQCAKRIYNMRVICIPVSILLSAGKRLQVRSFSARFVAHVAVKEKMPDRKPFSRLPKDVIPKNYAIRLKPDLSKLTFEGQQAIAVQVPLWYDWYYPTRVIIYTVKLLI